MSLRDLTALPVFNEERHVVDVISEVRKYSTDILLVDDGSSDKTPEILKTLRDVSVVRHQQNQGYGAALRTAFTFALSGQYDVLVTIDCDGQHQPALIPELAAAVFNQDDRPADIEYTFGTERLVGQFRGRRPATDFADRHDIDPERAVSAGEGDELVGQALDHRCASRVEVGAVQTQISHQNSLHSALSAALPAER